MLNSSQSKISHTVFFLSKNVQIKANVTVISHFDIRENEN